MPIRPPAGGEIRRLIGALSDADDVRRDSAIARLAVIGPRAVEHLLQDYESVPPRAKAGILRAFELMADARALAPARAALADANEDVAIAGVGTLRSLLTADRVSRDALDALVAHAVDTAHPDPIRLAALDALREAPADVRTPIYSALANDRSPAVSERVREWAGPSAARGSSWRDLLEGPLASPAGVKAALASHRATAPLTDLQRLVDRLRLREQQEPDPALQEAWRAARGAVHQALAARGSRLALYDLRDSLLGAERLPVAFLAALEEIGDASCLEPLAAAYEESSRSGDAWWREHVAAAFRAIVEREAVTRRHAVVKRLMSRWPDAAAELMG